MLILRCGKCNLTMAAEKVSEKDESSGSKPRAESLVCNLYDLA